MTGNDFINKVLKDFQNKTGMTSEELNQQMKIALHRIVNNREEVMANFSKMLESAMPQGPTMEEIEWEDDKHYLAEAEHVTLGKVVMIHPATDARIRCLCKWYGPHWVYNLTPAHLTPTGKRCTLTEVQE